MPEPVITVALITRAREIIESTLNSLPAAAQAEARTASDMSTSDLVNLGPYPTEMLACGLASADAANQLHAIRRSYRSATTAERLVLVQVIHGYIGAKLSPKLVTALDNA